MSQTSLYEIKYEGYAFLFEYIMYTSLPLVCPFTLSKWVGLLPYFRILSFLKSSGEKAGGILRSLSLGSSLEWPKLTRA